MEWTYTSIDYEELGFIARATRGIFMPARSEGRMGIDHV